MRLSIFTCKHALARLDDYLDRELTAKEIHQVERHLTICHACRRKFAFETELQQALRDRLQRIAAPESLRDTIRTLLQTED